MNDNVHMFMNKKASDMKSTLLELETDADIKNKIWELCDKPSEEFVMSIMSSDNGALLSAYSIFKNPNNVEAPFKYKIFKMDELSLWRDNEEVDTNKRDSLLLGLFINQALYKNLGYCEADHMEAYFTDDFKQTLGIDKVIQCKLSDWDYFPSFIGKKHYILILNFRKIDTQVPDSE